VSDPGALLEEVTRRVVEESRPEKVILFGSRARGEARLDSDIDLLVIKDYSGTASEEEARIYSALSGLAVAVDVVVVRPAYVERYGRLVGTVVRPALREGKTLYARQRCPVTEPHVPSWS
jgi:uncharacterized protein